MAGSFSLIIPSVVSSMSSISQCRYSEVEIGVKVLSSNAAFLAPMIIASAKQRVPSLTKEPLNLAHSDTKNDICL